MVSTRIRIFGVEVRSPWDEEDMMSGWSEYEFVVCGVGVVRLDSFVRFCRMGVSREVVSLALAKWGLGWVLRMCMYMGRGPAGSIVVQRDRNWRCFGVSLVVGWVLPSRSLVSMCAWVRAFAGSCA